ncbi:MAG TPA: DUF488 domain-containing protein [Ktedonobacteraceae bacterium]|nr:DUF488 domain-containing protein [Ktedonobacteraceae bacterium]
MSTIYTIGHSTRTIEQFIAMLQAHHVQELVDVRTVPRSRHNPQFGMDELAVSLEQAGIEYAHLSALGGLRHAHKDSINSGWRNDSFRGYADYMGTQAFQDALDELQRQALQRTVAIMCAEAVPWRCHRSLIADALTVQGWQVLHITSDKAANLHKLTPFLNVQGGTLTYPE